MKDFLNFTIVHLGDYILKVSSVIHLLIFFIIIVLSLHFTKKGVYRVAKFDEAKKYAIYKLIKYCVLVFSWIIGLQILGFNLSVLLAGSAALLVGVGLGLQNLFSDFVSGIILLVDSSIKVNDVIDVNGLVCKVQKINFRTTTVLSRDDKYLILPNSDLTKNQLINWTHNNIASRFAINVGVDYSSDVTLVMKILKDVVEENKEILKDPAPFVRFADYGDSALLFSVYFWSEEVYRVESIKSEIRVRIFEEFKLNKITIPFPQRVIHMNK